MPTQSVPPGAEVLRLALMHEESGCRRTWPPAASANIGGVAKLERVSLTSQILRTKIDHGVTLTKDLEEFVTAKVRTGAYTSSSEVVRAALREFRAKDDPAELDSHALAELLLPAMRGPHRALTPQHFAQLRRRARRKSGRP
jgi:putative addiction module CopG family antidote